ncbi:MAG: MBL fold metallo-hydrolase [Actinobacteria bacterium]|nr:MBL fold metallo-hydrolase [Actinomycetota bacterium]
MRVIDVEHLGNPNIIGCWEVDGMLVDPGPESSLRTLLEKLDDRRPEAILLTHIHLDHAAATGALVARWPELPVYVHERGAPHLVDPSRLVRSATMIYGDRMDELWGEILPVPEANVTTLAGGETVGGMRVAYTPGHASHHVSYLHEETGTAFVGDVAACRIPPATMVVPPTPPPDIDLELWEGSIAVIEGWGPERLAIAHFGLVDDPPAHLAELRRRLREEFERSGRMDQAAYEADIGQRLVEGFGPELAAALSQAVPIPHQWLGWDRYRRKKAEREGA